jgi:multiple sugar transport system substrate-binding protein
VQVIKDQQPQLKGKWATAPLPAGKSSTSFVGGASLVTFKDSEHKAAAKEFTKYLTGTGEQADWYEMSKSLPANKAAWNEPALKNAPEGLDAFEEQLKGAKTVPPLAKWEEFASKIDEGVARVSQKGESPKKAAAWMQKATKGLVD